MFPSEAGLHFYRSFHFVFYRKHFARGVVFIFFPGGDCFLPYTGLLS